MTKETKAIKKARNEFIKELERDPERLDALRVLEQQTAPPSTEAIELALAEKQLAVLRARVDRFAAVELEVTGFARQLRAEADPECGTTAFIYAHKVCGGNAIVSRPIPRAAILGLL